MSGWRADVLTFWFGLDEQQWWRPDPALDELRSAKARLETTLADAVRDMDAARVQWVAASRRPPCVPRLRGARSLFAVAAAGAQEAADRRGWLGFVWEATEAEGGAIRICPPILRSSAPAAA